MPDDRISDPQRVRALAHPLRLELMELLGAEPDLTATECAQRTGDSVASCSFHLRMLAKYGYVEACEPRGREKPWRLPNQSRTITPDHDDPVSVHEVAAFAELVVDREAERLRRWLSASRRESAEWIDASTINTSSFWLTAAEMKEVSEAITELTTRLSERFAARRDDPASRPPGARHVRVLAATSAQVEHDDESGGPPWTS